jgi:hypothetical protein
VNGIYVLPGKDGGYAVFNYIGGSGFERELVFGGDLTATLAYLRKRYTPTARRGAK